ncbi:MAG: ABC transporter substrate-binding protein, partial [Pseudomonadota bacterium]
TPIGAPTTLAILPYIGEQKVPLICPYAPDTLLVDPFKKNVFMITPVFYTQYYFITDYAIRVLGAKKIADIGQAGSPSGPQSVNDRLKEAGMSVVGEEIYKIAETDFSSLVMRLKSKEPDFCIVGTITRPGSLIAKEAQKQGWKPKLGFMSHSTIIDPEFVRLAGSAAEGFMALEIMKPTLANDPEVVEFRNRLKKYYPDIEPGMFAMHGYVSAMIFCEAMKKAGPEPTRDKLISALESMTGVNIGFMAPLSFSPTQHQGNLNARVNQVKNGNWEPITDWMKLPDRVK